MAKSLGRESTVDASADGVTYIPLENHMDGDVDHADEDVDAHTNDSGGFKDYERNWRQLTFTCRLYADTVAGHALLRSAHRNSTSLYWRVRERGAGAGKPELLFRGIPSLKKGAPASGLLTLNLTVRSKGTVTDQDQAA